MNCMSVSVHCKSYAVHIVECGAPAIVSGQAPHFPGSKTEPRKSHVTWPRLPEVLWIFNCFTVVDLRVMLPM